MTKKILVLSAAVGAGHMRAAEAVDLALRQAHPDFHVVNLDVLTMTNALFRRIYGRFYLDLVNKAPHVLGYFYDLMDTPSKLNKQSDQLRLILEKLNLKAFETFLKSEPWDLVINTHFLPAEILGALRKKKSLDIPQVTVTTDFETHRLWVNPPCERYFTATEEGARYLQHWGVPADKTEATGIPIHPVFATKKDHGECLKKHGIVGDRPILVQLAGGFGVGPIEKITEALLAVETPIDLIVVAGKNEKVRERLSKLPTPAQQRLKVIGFTKEIDELMNVADLVVSKPGGLTTSETLARGAIMVIVNPIPGQESRNSDYLLENGAAIKANNIGTLAFKVTQLLEDKPRMDLLRKNVKRIARPKAAFDVVEKSLAVLD
ncbi:MAG: glycosyltransferase [Planctomycetota bacterium]